MKRYFLTAMQTKVLAAALLISGVVQAQSLIDPSLLNPYNPPQQIPPSLRGGEGLNSYSTGEAFGPSAQVYRISATAFKVRNAGAALEYAKNGYWYAVGGTGGSGFNQYAAQIELPAGAFVKKLECFFFDNQSDSGTAGNANVGLWESQYNYSIDLPKMEHIVSVRTDGTPGFESFFVNLNKTLQYRDGANRNMYMLVANLPRTSNIRFRGCTIVWRRQISPPPATASFNDVPKTHPFFREIEAMAASGITGGCGGDNFCPNSTVTRAQMAAFLSRALGLHWPNN